MDRIKALVVKLLNRATAGYIRRNKIRVIAVAGSIGKTSTASAIRAVLSQSYKVHVPKTAYNVDKSVHLEMFDLRFASSIPGWIIMVARVLLKTLGKADYEVLVIEIGTDHPGELRNFAWLKPQIGVLTAIAPEHMEYFKTIEAVAEEELVIADFCRQLVFNGGTVDSKYLPDDVRDRAIWYGPDGSYRTDNYRFTEGRVRADFIVAGTRLEDVGLQVLGTHSLDALTAAAAVAHVLDGKTDPAAIRAGLEAFKPVAGRMQPLKGVDDSFIIDDSYNASPQAVTAALDFLYGMDVPKRIAVIGTMNEMGDYSPQAHQEVGEYCDPDKLDLLVTIGQDANDHLATAAEKRGCRVQRFMSPYEAGEYVRQQLEAGSAVLVKGSQNRVFAEEAIKSFLADPADAASLVRQSDYWMKRKRSQFGDPPASDGH